jgi:hypothetical protein
MNQSQQEKIIDLKKRYHRAIDGRRSGFFNKSINYGTKQIAKCFSAFYCLMAGNK